MNTISTIDGFKIRHAEYVWEVGNPPLEVTHRYQPLLTFIAGCKTEESKSYWKGFAGCKQECDNLNNSMREDYIWILGFDAPTLSYHPIVHKRGVVWDFNQKTLGLRQAIYETHAEALQAADFLNQ